MDCVQAEGIKRDGSNCSCDLCIALRALFKIVGECANDSEMVQVAKDALKQINPIFTEDI